MAAIDTPITKSSFNTSPYTYHPSGSAFATGTWYWFYKSNVCWDVYIASSTYILAGCYIRIDFFDYDTSQWIPIAADIGTQQGYGYQYTLNAGQTFRYFHNCLTNYNKSEYSATTKIKDSNVSSGGKTYDPRGYSLWRIGFMFRVNRSDHDFHINSFGPGYLTDAEYNLLCKNRMIFCGGKHISNSDDQNITSGTPQESDYKTLFLPSVFHDWPIKAEFDRQCIPDWRGFKT